MTRKHIVSIDDDLHISKLVAAVLSRHYEITCFTDATEALARLEHDLTPDLIICDITMPTLDGFALHQAIRNVPHLTHTPFIYLTALDDRNTFRRGMTQGADDYITKPFTPNELLDAVAIRLERQNTLSSDQHQIVPGLVIDSLGGVSLRRNGQIVQYDAKKVIELLLYLYTTHQSVPLETARKALWSEAITDNTLYVLINRTRKAFSDSMSLTVKDECLELKLHTPLDWDAEVFEHAAITARERPTYADAENAIARFKGEFLPGFDAPWTEQQRSYYDSLYLEMLDLSLERAPNEAARRSSEARLSAFLGD
jgi:two-component SAPR family response regulator